MKKFLARIRVWLTPLSYEEEQKAWMAHRKEIAAQFEEALKKDPESDRRLRIFFGFPSDRAPVVMKKFRAFGREVSRRARR